MAESKKIDIEVRIQGADQAATVMGGLNDKLDETSRSAGTAGGKVADTNEQVVAGGRKWGELAGAVGNAGAVFGQANPAIGQAGSLIGAVGTASSALTGAMGPLGVAIAVATTAFGIYQMAAQSAASNTRELAEAADQAEERIRNLMESISDSDASGNARAGTAAPSDIEARIAALGLETRALTRTAAEAERYFEIRNMDADLYVERLQTARANEQEGLLGSESGRAAASALITVQERQAEIERERAELVEGLTRATAGLTVEEGNRTRVTDEANRTRTRNEEIERRQQRRRRAGASGTNPKDASANADLIAITTQMRAEDAERQRLEAAATQRRADDQAAELIAAQLHDQELAQLDAAQDARKQDAHNNAIRRLEEQKAAERDAVESLKNDSMPLLSGAVNGLTDALSSVIAGTKSADAAFQGMLSSFLEMIAQQAALEAAKEFAAAIGSFASQDYGGGALHLAAGAAWTGVAVAAGAASIATAPAAASAPASPQQGGGDSGGGGSSYTFNINGPVLSAGSRANLGREISSITDEGSRRFGRTG